MLRYNAQSISYNAQRFPESYSSNAKKCIFFPRSAALCLWLRKNGLSWASLKLHGWSKIWSNLCHLIAMLGTVVSSMVYICIAIFKVILPIPLQQFKYWISFFNLLYLKDWSGPLHDMSAWFVHLAHHLYHPYTGREQLNMAHAHLSCAVNSLENLENWPQWNDANHKGCHCLEM